MKEIEDGLFSVTPEGMIFFTDKGFKEFGPLFVCEPVVELGAKVNKKTKLFCIEGMNMLSCLKSPFNDGVVTEVYHPGCASQINKNTPIITIKTKETNALHSL